MTQSRILGKLVVALGAAIAAMALLAGPASAAVPAPGYERFAGCPDAIEAPTVTSCQLAKIDGGHFKMGSKNVPIDKIITLSGGTNQVGAEFAASPSGGLSKTPLEVPGGVVGLTGLDWLVDLLSAEQLKLYAVTELAGDPVLTPAAFKMPIKVHLINEALGNNCYVGSDAAPIQLNLITGKTEPPPPNESIEGKPPVFSVGTPRGVGVFTDGTFVDNSFAAPAAQGCRLFGNALLNIDAVVNIGAGLPSKAGTNETVQTFDLEAVARRFVYPTS